MLENWQILQMQGKSLEKKEEQQSKVLSKKTVNAKENSYLDTLVKANTIRRVDILSVNMPPSTTEK